MNKPTSDLRKKNLVLLALLIGFCAVMFVVSFIRFGATVNQ